MTELSNHPSQLTELCNHLNQVPEVSTHPPQAKGGADPVVRSRPPGRLPLPLILLATAALAPAQTPQALFQTKCAQCHNIANTIGAPPPRTLSQMSWQSILAALETGKMKGIGDTITPAEREAIAKFLGTPDSQSIPQSARCPNTSKHANTPTWNGWADAANTRFQSAKAAGLNRQTTPKLKLKWAFGFPNVTTAFGTPTIFDGSLFIGAADGTVYSLDAQTGCVYWTYTAASGVRVSPVLGNGEVYFGDLQGNVYALESATGRLLWKTRADEHPMAVITGSPKLVSGKLYAGRLYVPVSGRDESIAATNPSYECCTFRGSVVALDAATGKQDLEGLRHPRRRPNSPGRMPRERRPWDHPARPSGPPPPWTCKRECFTSERE